MDPDTVQKVVKEVTQEEKDRLQRFNRRPPLEECLSLHDFEVRGPRSTTRTGLSIEISDVDRGQSHHAHQGMGILQLCRR